MRVVPVARRTLFIEKRRAAFGVGGVTLALLIVLALGSIFDGAIRDVTRYIDTADADIFVAQSGVRNMHMSLSTIPENSAAAVRSIEGVERVDPILFETSPLRVGPERQLSYLIGYEPGGAGGPAIIVSGAAPGPGEIVIDVQTGKRLGVGLDGTVDALGTTWRVSGLTENMTNITNTVSYVRRSDFARARASDGTVSYLLVGARSPATTAQRIEEEIGLEALTTDRFSLEERRIVEDMSADLMRIMTLSGFLIGLAVIVLVLYSATLARLREIGVMKALGASNFRLVRFIVSQAAWTILPALGLSIAVTMSLAVVLELVGSDISMWLSPQSVIRVGSAGVVLGAIGAATPLLRVMRVDPASVFRR